MIRKRSSLSPLQHGPDPSWTGVPVGLSQAGDASAPAVSDQSEDSGVHAGEALVWRYSPGGDDESGEPNANYSQQARRAPRPSIDGEEDRLLADDGHAWDEAENSDWTGEDFWEFDWVEDEDLVAMPGWPGEDDGSTSDPEPAVGEQATGAFEGGDGAWTLLAPWDPSGDLWFDWDPSLRWDWVQHATLAPQPIEGAIASDPDGEEAPADEPEDDSSEDMPTDGLACVMVAPDWLGGDGEEAPEDVGEAPLDDVRITDQFGALGIDAGVTVCFPGIEIL